MKLKLKNINLNQDQILNVKSKDNYNEIIQVYPDVRYTTYYKQRQRQIKIGQNC